MLITILIYILSTITRTNALYVTGGSPCSATCQSQNGSWYTDMVCNDDDFSNTAKGTLLQQCMRCQGQSLYVNASTGRSDEYWYIWHMKLVQQSCIVETYSPHIAAVESCATECSPIRTVLQQLWINKEPFFPQYSYCTNDSNAYPTYGPKCASCLQAQKGSVIIGNMANTMINACKDKPLASNNSLINTTRDLFNTTVISLSTSTNSTNSNSTNTSPDSSPVSSNTANSSRGLSAGAGAGIGIGIAVLLIAIVTAVVVLLRKRKRRSQVSSNGVTSPPQQSHFFGFGGKHGKDEKYSQALYYPPSRTELGGQSLSEADGRPIENAHRTALVELPTQNYR